MAARVHRGSRQRGMAVRGTGTTASDAVGVAADLKDGCLQVLAKIKAALARLMIGRGTSESDELAIPPIEYKGYRIRPTPYGTNDQYQTAGVIEKTSPTE